jgi:hypothetical protein
LASAADKGKPSLGERLRASPDSMQTAPEQVRDSRFSLSDTPKTVVFTRLLVVSKTKRTPIKTMTGKEKFLSGEKAVLTITKKFGLLRNRNRAGSVYGA